MRQRNFVWAITKAGAGWLPEGAPAGWYSGEGFLAAHDTLEHLSDKPDWAHELRATGASAFHVKYMQRRDMSGIAEDIVQFAAADHAFTAPAAPARWAKPLRNALDEAVVQEMAKEMREIIDIGTAKLKHDAKVRRDAQRYLPDADLEKAMANAPTFVDKALPWIRLGYAGAKRAYGGSAARSGHLMNRLTEAINSDHNRLQPVVGDKLAVTVDLKAATFTLKRSGNEGMSANERRTKGFITDFMAAFAGAMA